MTNEIKVILTEEQFDYLWICFARGSIEKQAEWSLEHFRSNQRWPLEEIHAETKAALIRGEMQKISRRNP